MKISIRDIISMKYSILGIISLLIYNMLVPTLHYMGYNTSDLITLALIPFAVLLLGLSIDVTRETTL